MATEQQLKQALIQAHNNGDTQAAELFASKIKQLRSANQGGNGVQTSPSQPVVDTPQITEQRSTEFDPINTDRAIGGLEGAASMISGMVAEPVAGLSGLVAAANPFAEEGAGGRTVEQVRNMLTYQPRTQSGKSEIAGISEVIQPVGEALQKVRDTVGDDALSVTGSPVVAAAFSALPDATLAMLGLNKAGKVKNAKITREQLSKSIAAGDVNAGNIAKALDADGRLVQNQNLKKAIDLMGNDEAAYSTAINFEKMNPATKKQVNKFLDVIEDNYKSGDPAKIMENRPANVVGESLALRVNKLNEIRKEASKKIGDIVRGDAGSKSIKVQDARDNFINALRESDVDFTPDEAGKLSADSSRSLTNVSEVIGDRKINNILNKLESGTISAKEAHKMKRTLREMVDFDPRSPGAAKVSDEIQSAVKDLASSLNDKIGQSIPSYKNANLKISESMSALKEADRLLGNRLMIGDDLADSKLGAMAKRIGTNLASRDDVTAFLNTLDDALAKRGIRPKDDITRQVAALADLEKIFKVESSQAPFGFKARVEQGVADAATGQGVVTQGINLALDKFRDMNKLEFNDKMKALRQLAKTNEK